MKSKFITECLTVVIVSIFSYMFLQYRNNITTDALERRIYLLEKQNEELKNLVNPFNKALTICRDDKMDLAKRLYFLDKKSGRQKHYAEIIEEIKRRNKEFGIGGTKE